MEEQEFSLIFLNKSRCVGSITLTESDKQVIEQLSKKLELDPNTLFTSFFRHAIRHALKACPDQPSKPAEIPDGHILLQVTKKDEKCLQKRIASKKSESMPDMVRQALNYVNSEPNGNLFTGQW